MMLKAEVVFLLPEDGSLAVLAAYPPEDQLDANDLAAAEWCWRNDTPAGRGSDNLPGAPRLFLPLRTGRGKLGVAGIKKDLTGPLLTPAERRLLDALLDQTALAIDRVLRARRRRHQAPGGDRAAAYGPADLDRPRPEGRWHPSGRRLRPAQLRRLLRRGRPRDLLATAPGRSRAAGAFRRQPARHDPAGGGGARTQARAGRRRRRGGLGPGPYQPPARRPPRGDRPAGQPAAAARRLRAAGAGAGQPARERRAMRRPARRWRSPRASATRPSCSRSATAAWHPRTRRTHLRPVLSRAQRGARQGWASVSPWPRASSRPWAAPSGRLSARAAGPCSA